MQNSAFSIIDGGNIAQLENGMQERVLVPEVGTAPHGCTTAGDLARDRLYWRLGVLLRDVKPVPT